MDFYSAKLKLKSLTNNKWEDQSAKYTLFVIASNYNEACQKINIGIIQNSSDTIKYELADGPVKLNGILEIKKTIFI